LAVGLAYRADAANAE
jgi:hypothetical protein